MIIQLADGYNGSTAKFDSFPLEIDGNCVKLRCADDGKEYMIRWATFDEVNQAVKAQLEINK